MTLAAEHVEISNRFLKHAEEQFQLGDMPKASKSAWDAVECYLDAVAEQRGWAHETYLDLSRVITSLAEESENPRQMRGMFLRMTGLYVNSYEDWFEEVFVRDGIEEAKDLIAMLEKE